MQKEAGTDLPVAEDFFREIVERSGIGIATHKPDGTVMYVNQYMADLLGYPRDYLIGRSDLDFVDQDSKGPVIRLHNELEKGKNHVTGEMRIRRKDGSALWTRIELIRKTDSRGNYAGYVITHTDITEQKQLEKKIQEAQVKAEMLIRFAPTGIYELDYIGPKFLSINDTMSEITGYSREELLSMNPFHLLDEQSAVIFQQRMRNILEGKPVAENVEYKIKLKDGTELWAVLNIKIIEEKGKPHHALVIAHDITRQKINEEMLRETRDLQSAILKNTHVSIACLDRDFNFIVVNEIYARADNHEPGFFTGKNHFSLFPNAENETIFRKVVETGEPYYAWAKPFEYAGNPERGMSYWDWSLKPVKNSSGQVTMLVLTLLNVTDRVQAEEALRESSEKYEDQLKKYNAILEEKVRERTEDLQRLNEALLRSNRELENFAYITSHDLQEPLRMITSFTQLLEREYGDQLDQNAREYIGFAVDGAKRMYEMINGLLAYSRINRKEVSFTNVDLNSVMTEVRSNLDLIIKEKNCVIEAGELPVVSADKTQMMQLFQNLISNGIKFSNNEPRITISCKKNKSDYIFSVKDEGIGIEEQYFNKIFEIFRRLHLKEKYEGTGIGLAICKRIVENHKGEIWVESEPGQGSVFYFSLPVTYPG